MLKRILKVALKVLVAVCVFTLIASAFVYFSGVQYTLALLTGTLRDPFFDASRHDLENNCGGTVPCSSGDIRVLTYNVLCRICVKESYDPWDTRIEYLRGLVERYDPDLIGSQELGGWKDMEEFLPANDAYATVSFEFGPWTYGDSALFYRKSRYELLDSGHFWLSPTPHVPFNFGWKPLSAPRYLTWALLRDVNTGFTFLFMNSHVDNNPQNKDASAPLIFKTFAPHAAKTPIIFTGDFNTNPTHERYEVFKRGLGDDMVFINTADLVETRWQQVYAPAHRDPVDKTVFAFFDNTIDHILLAGPVEKEVHQWVVDYNTYGATQMRASDHPAIVADLRVTLKQPQSDSLSATH